MSINQKQIQKTLSESVFSPQRDPAFKTACEAGTQYCMMRAIELIREATRFSLISDQSAKLKQAISLLALVRVAYNEQIQSDQAGGTGSEDTGSRNQNVDP